MQHISNSLYFSYFWFVFLTETLHWICKSDILFKFSNFEKSKTSSAMLAWDSLNISEIFAKKSKVHNTFRLKAGKLLKLNTSQEVFIKICSSGEQYYQFIFWGIILSNATGRDKLLRKGFWTHKWLEKFCIIVKGDVFSF